MLRIIAIFACLVALLLPQAATTSVVNDGEELYRQRRFHRSAQAFTEELKRNPNSPALHTNLGCALYQLKRYNEAIAHFNEALKLNPSPGLRARILYNLGNAQYYSEKIDEAIEFYKSALRLRPNDRDAKFNLELALRQQSMNSPPDPAQDQQSGSSQGASQSQDQGPPNRPPEAEPPQTGKQPQDSSSKASQIEAPRMTREEAERILDSLRQRERARLGRSHSNSARINPPNARDW